MHCLDIIFIIMMMEELLLGIKYDTSIKCYRWLLEKLYNYFIRFCKIIYLAILTLNILCNASMQLNAILAFKNLKA